LDRGKQKVVKADRNILQRLITAYKAGREINLEMVLQYELMPVPVALVSRDGISLSTNKSALVDILLKDINTPVYN
jgi:hypothetical protein